MNLKDWITNNQISVSVMAKSLDVSNNYLYRILRKEVQPSKALCEKIADYTQNEIKTEDLKRTCPTCGKGGYCEA